MLLKIDLNAAKILLLTQHVILMEQVSHKRVANVIVLPELCDHLGVTSTGQLDALHSLERD